MLNALTVDVEDWYHVCRAERFVPRARWVEFEDRVADSTHRLLDLFADHHARATFHVLGYVAERHPELVRQIARRGHDIGVHSYWHRRVDDLTPEEFERDLVLAKAVVERVVEHSVKSFRAPEWSVTHRTPWAFDILRRCGFEYDSSLMPAFWVRRNGWGTTPFKISTSHGTLWEFPGTIVRYLGAAVPVAEGTVLRLVPAQLLVEKIRSLNRQGIPANLSIHPWEIDPDFPCIRLPLVRGFMHNANRRTTLARLEMLLETFRFGSISRAIEDHRTDGTALRVSPW